MLTIYFKGEHDRVAFVRAIFNSRALAMIALINTLTEELFGNPSKLVSYKSVLLAENQGNPFDYPFQHDLKYILYVVTGRETQRPTFQTPEEAKREADETSLIGQFHLLAHHHSSAPQKLEYPSTSSPAPSTTEQDTVTRQEDLEPGEGEEATVSKKKKKKRKKRNKHSKEKMGTALSVLSGASASGSNDPAVAGPAQISEDAELDDVAVNDNNNSNGSCLSHPPLINSGSDPNLTSPLQKSLTTPTSALPLPVELFWAILSLHLSAFIAAKLTGTGVLALRIQPRITSSALSITPLLPTPFSTEERTRACCTTIKPVIT